MLLDYKINKKLTPIGDKLYEDVIKYLRQFTEVKITAKRMTDIKRCCYCIILNTSYIINRGRPYITLTLNQTSYSNPAIYNGNNTGRKISYTNMKIVLSYLENFTNSRIEVGGATDFELEYDNTKGRLVMAPKNFETSKLYLCESMLYQVAQVTESSSIKDSVLEVRDSSGRPVGIRLTEREKNLIKVLNAFNVSLDKGEINVQDERFYISVRKIYNNSSLKEGGRIFMTGANVSDLIKKDNRRQIVIDGSPTIELDYAQLWPRMAADLLGQELDSDFDVYGVEIEGYCKNIMRELCKVGLMCLINSDSFESAYYATLSELKSSGVQEKIDSAKSRGEWQEFPIIRKMLDMLMERNAYLVDYFFSKKATFLMNVESSLMDYMLERAVEDDRILIPIHDSVVVQEDYADIAESNMYKAYDVVVGGNNCVVRRK